MAVKYIIPGMLLGMSVTDAVMEKVTTVNVIGCIFSLILFLVFYSIDYKKEKNEQS